MASGKKKLKLSGAKPKAPKPDKKLTPFTLFSKLPPKVRNIIWGMV